MFMDFESRFGSSANPSSSSNFSSAAASCSSTSLGSSATAVDDRMGDIELEAAEALADLAHLAMRESGAAVSCDSGSMWGCKGKQAIKRVNSQSPPSDSRLNPVVDSVAASSDVPNPSDRGVVDQQEHQPQSISIAINPIRVEQEVDLTKASASYARSYSTVGGGRCRQNLTETEKEERRLRRILANRESARQTIRRRQALCEELTRKAADLAWENQKLKQEKQMAVKEYQSLEATNEKLKLQMNKVIKVEEEVSPLQLNLANVEMPTSPTANCPMLLYNQHSFPQLCWSSSIHSSSSAQPHLGQEDVPPNNKMPSYRKPDPFHQPEERTIDVNGPRTSLYIMPCPWFFSLPDSGHGIHPQISFGPHMEVTSSAINQGTGSSSTTASVAVKSESFGQQEGGLVNDLNETPVASPPEGIVDSSMTLGPVTLDPIRATGPVKSEFQYDDGAYCTNTGYMKACQVSGMSEKDQDAIKFAKTRTTDAAAASAAEARRRRKELTKLKYLHGQQCQRTLEL